MTGDDINAKTLVALHGIVGLDGGNDVVHVPVDRRKVDLRLMGRDPEAPGTTHRVGGLAGGKQGLGRHATEIEAIAAHPHALDEHRSAAHVGCGVGGDEPS